MPIHGAAVGCVAMLASAGCSGGHLQMVSLNFRRMDNPAPLIERIDFDECCWWTNDQQLQIGLRRHRTGAPSEFARERIDLSLVLDGFPADKSRDYLLDAASLRGYVRRGANHERFASIRGVIRVSIEGDALRARFRMATRKQMFHALTGWVDVPGAVLVGEFVARKDARLGTEILKASEEDGMSRRGAANNANGQRSKPKRVEGPPVAPPES